MAKKNGPAAKVDEGSNQFERREGLKGVTSVSSNATDPMLLSIRAPKPKEWQKLTVTVHGFEYAINVKDFVGPNDSFELGPCYCHTFDWQVNPYAVKLAVGELNVNPIVCRHIKGEEFATVNEGRHRTLIQRIANHIRADLGKTPFGMIFRKGAYTPEQSAIITEISNRRFKRDPIAVLEQNIYIIDQAGWNDEQAAEHFDVKPTTIRSWRHRLAHIEGPDASEGYVQQRVRSGLKKPAQKKLFNVLKDKSYPDEWAQIAELFLTGELPADASPAVKAAWKAAQS